MSKLYHHKLYRDIFDENKHFFNKAEFYFWSDFDNIVRLWITLYSNQYGYNKVEAAELKNEFEKELDLPNCIEMKHDLLNKRCEMRYDLSEEVATTLYGYLNLCK